MAQDDIQGQVVDPSGNPVSGAIVELTRSYESNPVEEQTVLRTTTDSNGNYIFETHPDGDGTTQDYHVSCYNYDGTAYVNSNNNPGVSADLGPAIPDSVVSFYKFNDNSDTTVAIDSVGSNNGTINGPTYTTAAIEGDHSLQYDGSNDFVNLGNDSSFDYNGSAVSLSIGVNTTNTSDKMVLWNSRDASTRESWQNLNINSDGTLEVALRDGDGNIPQASTSSAPGVRDGNDHFITAGIADGNNVRFYVDGSLFEEVSFGSANAFSQVTDIYLGRRLDGPLAFGGILDVASYAESQLTLEEHQELMP